MTSWSDIKDPSAIRAELPIAWVLGELFGVWVTADEMVSCPLPGHDDDTPSFNLWAFGDDGLPQRFGCFGCGVNGDVIDLIREAHGIGFSEAMAMASTELIPAVRASGWTPTAVPDRVRVAADPGDLEAVLARYADMTARGYASLDRFATNKGLPESMVALAMDRWEWGGIGRAQTARGIPTVYFPHRDRDGTLTGIKYRDPRVDGGRWNEDGSRFPALYGSWLDRGRADVVLCEGETDTVWMSYVVGDEMDAMGLPSGASQTPTDDMIAQLTGRRVFLAFDADPAGMKAARKWALALWGPCQQQVFVVRLPGGEDVLSHRLTLPELRQRAIVPRQRDGNPVNVIGGRFTYAKDVGTKANPEWVDIPIADFGLDVIAELVPDNDVDGPAYRVMFVDDGRETVIRADDFTSPAKLVKWATAHGGRTYTGPAMMVQHMANWVARTASFRPIERASSKAGRIGSSYVWPGGHVGRDHITYVPPTTGSAGLSGKIDIRPGPFDPMALAALERLNDPGVMAIIIGWYTATLLRGERAPAPPLFVAGESGSGKTIMLDTFLRAFGFGIEATLTTTTPYGVNRYVDSTIGFPVWFDEFRHGAREDSMMRMRQILRDAYNGQLSVMGGLASNVVDVTEVTTWAGIIVSGEMGTAETSHMDRLVMVELDPDQRNPEAHRWLTRTPGATTGLSYAMLEWLAARPPALFDPRPVTAAAFRDLPDRYRHTLGFVASGWDAWLQFRRAVGAPGDPVGPDYERLAARRSESVDPWMEALEHCLGKYVRDGSGIPIVQNHPDGLVVLAAEVVREADTIGIQLPAGAKELITWLRRRYPDTRRREIGGRRGWIVPGLEL